MTYFHEEQRFGRGLWVLVLVFGAAVLIPLIGRSVPLAALAFGPIVIAIVYASLACLAQRDARPRVGHGRRPSRAPDHPA